jgi:predicted DNA-binding ribbon-helix-helix protein
MSLHKKSFSLSGHRTSVALEAEFWTVLKKESVTRGQSMTAFVSDIDKARGTRPLASALRLAALAAVSR